jgi:hypothetical protein
VLAKVTVVKIANYGTSVCSDVAAYTGSVLVVVCMLHCSEVVLPNFPLIHAATSPHTDVF